MPEKKIMNTKDADVVEERRALLEKFLKDCAKFDYIIFSKEFKIFSRGYGEVDKELLGLPKQTPMQVLEKYKLHFTIEQEESKEQLAIFNQNI
jgi:sorting nexin-1/2